MGILAPCMELFGLLCKLSVPVSRPLPPLPPLTEQVRDQDCRRPFPKMRSMATLLHELEEFYVPLMAESIERRMSVPGQKRLYR